MPASMPWRSTPPAASSTAARGECDPFLGARLPSLDGLRFLAAALVIIYHGGCDVPAPDGVTFFFVLSGFLFAVLLDREFQRTGTINLRHFYARRAIRILPAFYAALGVTIVGKLLLGNSVDAVHAAAAALFAGNYFNALNGHPATGFAHFWSLAVEEQFYLVWPVTFLLLARVSRRTLMAFLAVAILAVGAWRTAVLHSGVEAIPYAYNAFECRFDSLATGCLTGLLTASSGFRGAIRQTCRTGFEPLLVIALLIWSTRQPVVIHHGPGFTFDSLLMALLLVQLVALGNHPAWRWLNWSPLRYLGMLSYSAYLLHAWGLALASKIPGTPLVVRIGLGIAFTMLLAWVQYQLVERPALAWRERFQTRGRGVTAAPNTTSVEPGTTAGLAASPAAAI